MSTTRVATREEFDKQMGEFTQTYVRWMNETAAQSQTRFAIPLAEVLQDMKRANIDTAHIEGYSFFNGNKFGREQCAATIGTLAEKLPR